VSPGLKWIFAIVGLLLGNLIAMGILIGAAQADKPQVIPQYYDRAAHYNDAIGKPLTGALVQIAGTNRAGVAGSFDVKAAEATPGQYRIDGARQRGIYDLGIVVARGSEKFVQRAMVEAR
jgi:hypothetical protein